MFRQHHPPILTTGVTPYKPFLIRRKPAADEAMRG